MPLRGFPALPKAPENNLTSLSCSGTKRKRSASEAPEASPLPSPISVASVEELPSQSSQQVKPSAFRRAKSSPPALQASARIPSPDEDNDLFVPLSFAKRAATAAPSHLHKSAADIGLSLHATTASAIAPAYDAAASNFAGLHSDIAAGDYGSLHHVTHSMPQAAIPDLDEQIYDVPEDDTSTKPKAKYGNMSSTCCNSLSPVPSQGLCLHSLCFLLICRMQCQTFGLFFALSYQLYHCCACQHCVYVM